MVFNSRNSNKCSACLKEKKKKSGRNLEFENVVYQKLGSFQPGGVMGERNDNDSRTMNMTKSVARNLILKRSKKT